MGTEHSQPTSRSDRHELGSEPSKLQGNQPKSNSDRRKLFIALGICIVCIGWLGYYYLSQVDFRGPDLTLRTPGWKIAGDLFNEISADHAYSDIAFRVESENPLKIAVIGEIYSKPAFDRLPDMLKELQPGVEFDIQAEFKKR